MSRSRSQMGRRNRQRGSEFEKECEKALHALGFKTARKTGSIAANGLGQPDLQGIPGVYVSCKRWKVMRWALWWRDADQHTPTGQAPMILHRGDRGAIYCSIRLQDLPSVMQGLDDSASASRLLHP